MTETEFNAAFRAVLRTQGLGGLHIREADQPGVSDLVVWQGRSLQAWAELKVDDRAVEPQQMQFLQERETESGSAYVIRFNNNTGLTYVARPLSTGLVMVDVFPNFRLVKWKEFFGVNRRQV